MKTIARLLFAALLLVTTNSCKDEIIDPPPTDIDVDLKSAEIIEADNLFGLELFNLIVEEETQKPNLMISPMSVSIALAMAYNGADGETKTQMEEMLHKQGLTAEEINASYKKLVDALDSHDPRVELSIANSIFYNNHYVLKSEFLQTNQSFYDAEVNALDFSNSAATLQTINNWVKSATHNKIDKILEELSPNDVLYLINAIYFNGKWTYQFEKKNTHDRNFTTADGSVVQVPTMTIKEDFNYTATDEFELLEMPYGGGKYSMMVFLPQDGYDTDDVINALTPDAIGNWIDQMTKQTKTVYMPKFEYAYDNELVENLKALGMIDAFSDTDADFSGISDVYLYISKVKHKSYIRVDEQGTEAAAVTSIGFETTSVGPSPVFSVDHPFIFSIYEKDTKAILFIGKVTNPNEDNE